MDTRLREQLNKVDEHIKKLFDVELMFLQLDGSKKALQAQLTLKSLGKSHAERETKALASDDWENFCFELSNQEAQYNREKRRYELLLKAFDAEYLTMKVEAPAIKRQL